MSYKHNPDALNQLHMTLIANGYSEDVDTMISKIVGSIPPATRENFDPDDLMAAIQYFDIWHGKTGDVAGLNPAPVATQPVSETAQPSPLTSQQSKAISDLLKADVAGKAARTAKTRMERILFDKPLAKEYLDPSMTVIPRCTKAKLEEYRKNLVEDQENVAAFEEIAAACDTEGTGQGSAMPINISNALKPIGYTISTPSREAGSEVMETRHMTIKELLGFVAFELAGVIPTATPSDLGCKLTIPTKRNRGEKASVSSTTGTPRLRVVGRQAAMEDANKHDFTSVATAQTKKGKLRIEKTFKIYTGKTDAKGERKTRTIRLSGDAMVPVFERKNEEYAKAFPIQTKKDGIELLTGKAAYDMQRTQADAVAFIMAQGGGELYDYGLADVADKINNDLAKNATENVTL